MTRPVASTFTNIVEVTREVTVGLRSVQSRATWYLVKLGTVHVRRSLGTTDLRTAKAKALRAYQAWLDAPNSDWLGACGITNHHVSFKQCAEQWLATQTRDRSYKADVIRKFLLPFFDVERSVTNIATINAALIDDYKLWRRTFWLSNPSNPQATAARRANVRISAKQIKAMEAMEEPSPNTLNREYPTLRQILKYSEQRGYLPRGHAPTVAPEPANANPRPAFMAGDFNILHSESQKWISEAETEDLRHKRQLLSDWIYVNRYTGLRLPHEAALLKWTDINLPAAILFVSEQTKTGRREVPLRNEALIRLSNMKARRKAYCEAHSQTFNETEPVFVLVTGTPYGDLPKMFSKLIVRCNFPSRAGLLPYTPYSLRHTYATFALAEGKDYPWLEEVMGTSMKMLKEHYKQGTIEQTRRYLQEQNLLPPQGIANYQRIDQSVGALTLIDPNSLPVNHPMKQTLTLLPPKRK